MVFDGRGNDTVARSFFQQKEYCIFTFDRHHELIGYVVAPDNKIS